MGYHSSLKMISESSFLDLDAGFSSGTPIGNNATTFTFLGIFRRRLTASSSKAPIQQVPYPKAVAARTMCSRAIIVSFSYHLGVMSGSPVATMIAAASLRKVWLFAASDRAFFRFVSWTTIKCHG